MLHLRVDLAAIASDALERWTAFAPSNEEPEAVVHCLACLTLIETMMGTEWMKENLGGTPDGHLRMPPPTEEEDCRAWSYKVRRRARGLQA
jgi:hypothetical protein